MHSHQTGKVVPFAAVGVKARANHEDEYMEKASERAHLKQADEATF